MGIVSARLEVKKYRIESAKNECRIKATLAAAATYVLTTVAICCLYSFGASHRFLMAAFDTAGMSLPAFFY